jgi:hypothetical protein
MKVTTNLKSGNFLEDATQSASNLGDKAQVFFSSADQQAKDLTGAVVDSANSLWLGLANLVGF